MDQKSLKRIQDAAVILPETPAVALSGALLTARYCCDALMAQQGNPIIAKDVAALVQGYGGGDISSESIRQILRALKAGGLRIGSARSRGYWLE